MTHSLRMGQHDFQKQGAVKREPTSLQGRILRSYPGSLRLFSGRFLRGAAGGTAEHPHGLR